MTTTPKFTVEDVFRVADTLPKDHKNPRFRYSTWKEAYVPATDIVSSSCRYADPQNLSQPSCMVGTIAWTLNPAILPQIAESGARASGTIGPWFDEAAILLLDEMQYGADHDKTWGQVVWDAHSALDAAPEVR
jgi:hypothetical protein